MANPIRIALSGSGFKFPAHVGALKAVLDAGYTITELAGTSGGSIVAALYASGMPISTMYTLCMTEDWSGMIGFSLGSILSKMSYCSGDALLTWLRTKLEAATFGTLKVPLTVVATDVGLSQPRVFSAWTTPQQEVAEACRASASIPFVYAPVQIGPRILMDGGVIDNMPVDLLTVDSTPRLGIHLTARDAPMASGTYSAVAIAGRLLDLMMDSSEAAHARIAQNDGARMAVVETGFASGLDTKMPIDVRRRLFDAGYNAAKQVMGGV